MVAAVSINAPQARILVGSNSLAGDIRVPQIRTLVAINFPAENIQSTQGAVLAAVRQTANSVNVPQASVEAAFRQTADIDVTQARVLVAGKGRIANPTVRAWTFSLDGHDFYVLRLGDTLTLVYDVATEQWVDWQDPTHLFWRPNIGFNWVGAAALAQNFGSTAVCGDDTYGLIWFLNPEQPYDQHPNIDAPVQELYFPRVTMGQVPLTGRQVQPCYALWLTADMGDPAYDGAGVTLEISDNGGKSFENMGSAIVSAGVNMPEISWYSLGQFGAPGRLFKITDDGAVARIDSLEMNDPDDS